MLKQQRQLHKKEPLLPPVTAKPLKRPPNTKSYTCRGGNIAVDDSSAPESLLTDQSAALGNNNNTISTGSNSGSINSCRSTSGPVSNMEEPQPYLEPSRVSLAAAAENTPIKEVMLHKRHSHTGCVVPPPRVLRHQNLHSLRKNRATSVTGDRATQGQLAYLIVNLQEREEGNSAEGPCVVPADDRGSGPNKKIMSLTEKLTDDEIITKETQKCCSSSDEEKTTTSKENISFTALRERWVATSGSTSKVKHQKQPAVEQQNKHDPPTSTPPHVDYILDTKTPQEAKRSNSTGQSSTRQNSCESETNSDVVATSPIRYVTVPTSSSPSPSPASISPIPVVVSPPQAEKTPNPKSLQSSSPIFPSIKDKSKFAKKQIRKMIKFSKRIVKLDEHGSSSKQQDCRERSKTFDIGSSNGDDLSPKAAAQQARERRKPPTKPLPYAASKKSLTGETDPGAKLTTAGGRGGALADRSVLPSPVTSGNRRSPPPPPGEAADRVLQSSPSREEEAATHPHLTKCRSVPSDDTRNIKSSGSDALLHTPITKTNSSASSSSTSSFSALQQSERGGMSRGFPPSTSAPVFSLLSENLSAPPVYQDIDEVFNSPSASIKQARENDDEYVDMKSFLPLTSHEGPPTFHPGPLTFHPGPPTSHQVLMKTKSNEMNDNDDNIYVDMQPVRGNTSASASKFDPVYVEMKPGGNALSTPPTAAATSHSTQTSHNRSPKSSRRDKNSSSSLSPASLYYASRDLLGKR